MKGKEDNNDKGRDGRLSHDPTRRPASPPGHAFSHAKPEERAHPAERKVKHKRRPANEE